MLIKKLTAYYNSIRPKYRIRKQLLRNGSVRYFVQKRSYGRYVSFTSCDRFNRWSTEYTSLKAAETAISDDVKRDNLNYMSEVVAESVVEVSK